MANPDRLSGLDASFLSLERSGAHMHVGSVLVFEGEAPPYEEFVSKLEQRLHLVPRYRQKLAWPPLVQSRPVWIDDPHFNAHYHVRHTALPEPAGEEQLRSLKWVGWGSAKATATGKRRYCASRRCQTLKPARLELSGLAVRRCHPPSEGESTHPLARRVYTRYRLAATGKWLRAPLADFRLDCRQLP